jgi:hypothetical protein
MSTPTNIKEVMRLSHDQYAALERQLPGPVAQPTASEHHVGYLLGIQYVLLKLRQGFTVG